MKPALLGVFLIAACGVDPEMVTDSEQSLSARSHEYVCDLHLRVGDRELSTTGLDVTVTAGDENAIVARLRDNGGGDWVLMVTEQLGVVQFELAVPEGVDGDELELSVPLGISAFAVESDFADRLELGCSQR